MLVLPRLFARLKNAVGLCLAVAPLVCGCTVDDPFVDNPGDQNQRTQSAYADVVTGYGAGPFITQCTTSLPVCDKGKVLTPQAGPCANNPALGAPDMKTFKIGALGKIEIGLLCGTIYEIGPEANGMPSMDFKLWATASADALPQVEVSVDGSEYVPLNGWAKSGAGYADNPGFELEAQELYAARFVRIAEAGGHGTILVDALEAFPVKRP